MAGWASPAVGGADGGGMSRTVRVSLRCPGFARIVRAGCLDCPFVASDLRALCVLVA